LLHLQEFLTKFFEQHVSLHLLYLNRAQPGLDPSRVTYRPHAEALAAGDGSGWFFDPRNNVGFPTVSIEFTRGGLTLELGEVTRSGFAIGTERVQWAMTGAIPTWNQVLPTLLARIRAEAHRAHVQLPAGYGQFIWLGP
jgi:hypothetical protein